MVKTYTLEIASKTASDYEGIGKFMEDNGGAGWAVAKNPEGDSVVFFFTSPEARNLAFEKANEIYEGFAKYEEEVEEKMFKWLESNIKK